MPMTRPHTLPVTQTAGHDVPKSIEEDERHDPRNNVSKPAVRRGSCDGNPLGSELLCKRHIYPRRNQGRFSVRELVLELPLNRLLPNDDVSNNALRDKLLESAVGNGFDGAARGQVPLHQEHAEPASTASNETRLRVVDFSLISYGPPTIATRHDQE